MNFNNAWIMRSERDDVMIITHSKDYENYYFNE